ncbi:MAG: signal peptidase I, partial [Anaerovoracaceae bacterium]
MTLRQARSYIMKLWSKLPLIITVLLAVIIACYTVGMILAPDKTTNYVGYRPYIVLTDSMEPEIPTGSLVIAKTYRQGQGVTPGAIITFRVDVLREEIFTHYFRGITLDEDGREIYMTRGARDEYYQGPEDMDDYHTLEEDILGTYVFHLPYIGKVILYLRSPFGWFNLAIIFFILSLNAFLGMMLDIQERFTQAPVLALPMHLRPKERPSLAPQNAAEASTIKEKFIQRIRTLSKAKAWLLNHRPIKILKGKERLTFPQPFQPVKLKQVNFTHENKTTLLKGALFNPNNVDLYDLELIL